MIDTVPETGSTNADLLTRLADGDPLAEGYWLVADRQVKGRGRQGRHWEAATGNFMGSTIIRPGHGDPPSHTLSLVVGVAVHEAISATVPSLPGLKLKWPNDAMIAKGKLAGILLENAGGVIVAGIGVNLAFAPAVEGRATAALSQFGPAPDRDTFAQRLAQSLDQELERWRTYGLDALLRRWQAVAHPIGAPLTVHEPSGERISGTFAGLGEDGSLRLRLANGETRSIHAGEVSA